VRRYALLLPAWVPALMPAVAACQTEAGIGEQPVRLSWVAGDLPPFAWMSPDGPRGYAHELAVLMAQRLGRAPQVDYVPWARAVRMVEQSDHVGVFPLARTPDRETRFQWLVPLMTARYVFITRATGSKLSLAQLRGMRVGVLRGSPITANLREEKFSDIVDGKDYKDLLRMLDNGSLQAVYAGAPMLDAAIDTYGYARQHFSVQQSLGEARLFMAASRQLAPEEAARWQKAYQQLEDDGSAEKLRRRYFPLH
jgi:ABC-type amino acid transport substrate-binding protein